MAVWHSPPSLFFFLTFPLRASLCQTWPTVMFEKKKWGWRIHRYVRDWPVKPWSGSWTEQHCSFSLKTGHRSFSLNTSCVFRYSCTHSWNTPYLYSVCSLFFFCILQAPSSLMKNTRVSSNTTDFTDSQHAMLWIFDFKSNLVQFVEIQPSLKVHRGVVTSCDLLYSNACVCVCVCV